jgi:hypothetical protein
LSSKKFTGELISPAICLLVDFILLSKVGGFLKIVPPLAIQVKWFGTHTEYDKIDVESIIFKRR